MIVKIYWTLRGTREGRYSCVSIGITARFIECSYGIPCLYATQDCEATKGVVTSLRSGGGNMRRPGHDVCHLSFFIQG